MGPVGDFLESPPPTATIANNSKQVFLNQEGAAKGEEKDGKVEKQEQQK